MLFSQFSFCHLDELSSYLPGRMSAIAGLPQSEWSERIDRDEKSAPPDRKGNSTSRAALHVILRYSEESSSNPLPAPELWETSPTPMS